VKFLFITASPELSVFAASRGVDRIFVDLELLGKTERQGHLNTVISRHSFDDLRAVRRVVPDTEVMARLNPINADTQSEIDQAIDAGADILMLPMFRTVAEVREFTERTAGRARICLLAETMDAVRNLSSCVTIEGVNEVHIGLNDLSLDLNLPFLFQPLALGLVDDVAAIMRDAGMPFGIGGLARVGEGQLPAEMILGEHVRLGSTAAILSRTFHRQATTVAEIEADMVFEIEIEKLRSAYEMHKGMGVAHLMHNHGQVVARISDIVEAIRSTGKVNTGAG